MTSADDSTGIASMIPMHTPDKIQLLLDLRASASTPEDVVFLATVEELFERAPDLIYVERVGGQSIIHLRGWSDDDRPIAVHVETSPRPRGDLLAYLEEAEVRRHKRKKDLGSPP